MLTIRLFRVGKKNQPAFKIVVTDKKNPPRGGRFVEEVGFFNPLTKERLINKERMKYWLSVGARPSVTINNLLVVEKVLSVKKIPKHKKSKKPGPAEAAADKPASVPAGSSETKGLASTLVDSSGIKKEGEKPVVPVKPAPVAPAAPAAVAASAPAKAVKTETAKTKEEKTEAPKAKKTPQSST